MRRCSLGSVDPGGSVVGGSCTGGVCTLQRETLPPEITVSEREREECELCCVRVSRGTCERRRRVRETSATSFIHSVVVRTAERIREEATESRESRHRQEA